MMLKDLITRFKRLSLNDRIFVYILFFAIGTSVLLIIENVIIHYPMIANVKWVGSILLSTIFLMAILHQKYVKWIQISFFIILILVLLPFGWLNSSVHNPFTVAYSFLFCIGIVFFLEGVQQVSMIILLLLVVVTMTSLTYLKPEWFLEVPPETQWIDSLVQIVLTYTTAVLMLGTFTKAHKKALKQIEKKNEDLIYVTLHDELTGTYNRRYIFQEFESIKNLNKSKAILIGMVDIDNFKTINDTYGHEKGDQLLIETAKFIQDLVGDHGFVGRYGGDEFIIVIKDESEAYQNQFFEKLQAFSEDLTHKLEKTSFSGGFVRCRTDSSINKCLSLADKYLYLSKESGKNCFFIEGKPFDKKKRIRVS